MLICLEERCTCVQSKLLAYLKSHSNEEAKLILQYQNLGNLSDLADTSGKTLLHYLARYNNVDMMQCLINKGINIDAQDAHGITALTLAAKSYHAGIVQVLLHNDANIYMIDFDEHKNVLEYAFELCLETAARRDDDDDEKKNSFVVLNMLFDRVNKDFSDGTSMQWLSKATDSLKLMLVSFGHEDLARWVITKDGYPIDFKTSQHGYTALHCALRLSRLDNVKLLMELGADIDALSKDSRSALFHYAVNFQQADRKSEVLKSLLKYSANLSRLNVWDRTDIDHLLMLGTKETAKTVLLSGIDIDACLAKDRSLFFILAENHNDEVFELFRELNIEYDVNQCNAIGKTALMIAAYQGSSETGSLKKVEFLLNHGADVNVESDGMTALSSTDFSKCGYQSVAARIVEMLLQRGAGDAQSVLINEGLHLEDNFSLATRVIVAHLALQHDAGRTPLNDETRARIESSPLLKAHFNLCAKQLQEMKRIQAIGSISLFKMLTDGDEELTSTLNNALKNLSHVEPYYWSIFQRTLSRG